jgi:hypothetical protein
MKQIFTFLLLVAAFLSSATVANEEPGNSSKLRDDREAEQKKLREKEREARELAQEVLDGRQVVMRVYNNWQVEPEAYELVRASLTGLMLSFDPVKSAFMQVNESAVIVVIGQDQQDKAVRALLADVVFTQVYKKRKSLFLWPPFLQDPGQKWWVFNDALGVPIPEASVKIRILDCNHGAWISLGKVTLDEKGRLKRLKRINPLSKFIFIVSHPDYGTARVEAKYCPSLDNPPTTYVVHLVPLDSEAINRSIWGFVTDRQGNPVSGAEITCHQLMVPSGKRIQLYRGSISKALTDQQGWFAMYVPVEQDGKLVSSLVPPMVRYSLTVMPPKFLNLRQYNGDFIAGKQATITLNAMKGDEYFHTFAFEYPKGAITNLEELKKITIALYRDQRKWLSLKYDDWKDGSYLPSGILRASTPRWGYPFSFEPIEMTADSPEGLVFGTAKKIIYKGKVVNGITDEPMPSVLVLNNDSYSRKAPSSLKPEQWEQLRTQAAEDLAAGPSDKKLYDYKNRVTLTDVNGCYQVLFMPGFNTRLGSFTALEEGFVAESIYVGYLKPNANGIVEVPTIKLLFTGPRYFPALVFEDESGPVTDLEMLGQIQLRVKKDDGGMWCPPSYNHWLKIGKFVPGTYHATVDWNGKRYTFEPVDLTEQRPETVVFKIKEIKEDNIFIYRGQVVHGITGEPISGAIIMNCQHKPHRDASELEPEQWGAINLLRPELDANDVALAPLKEIFEFTKIAQTRVDGRFQIISQNRKVDEYDILIAIKKDYLGTEQQLRLPVRPGEQEGGPLGRKEFEPDENGCVTLPSIKLFPAGTIVIEPNIPDFGYNKKYKIIFHWRTSSDNKTAWLKDLWATPRKNKGGSVFYKDELRPNQIQSAYIAAGVELAINIYRFSENQWAPIVIPGVKLRQGEVLDLGRQDFQPALKVLVKVIDSASEPVEGVAVKYIDERGHFWGQGLITNEKGIVLVNVPPYSKGEFVIEYYEDRKDPNSVHLREGVAYEVGGEEDTGREFTMTISDEMLYQLFK